MTPEKKYRLQTKGWKVGSAEEFLGYKPLEDGKSAMRKITFNVTFEVKEGHLDESFGHWTEVFNEVEKCLTNGRHFEIQSMVTEYVQKLFPFVQAVRLDPTTSKE